MARLLSLLGAALILSLAACAPATPTPTPTSLPSPSPTVTPAMTVAPSPALTTPTRTAIPPTATGTATATVAPTLTATHTPAPATATHASAAPTRLPVTPTPQPVVDAGQAPPTCPAWFATPESGKGLLIFENSIDEPVTIDNFPSLPGFVLSAASASGSSFYSVQLEPGAYELSVHASYSGPALNIRMTVGASLRVLFAKGHKIVHTPVGDRGEEIIESAVASFAPPWGCPGGQPPPPPQCPTWFATPEPGKGEIVFENRTGISTVVDGVDGTVFFAQFPKSSDSEPTRVVASLLPGRYRFKIGFAAPITIDLQAGQQLVVRFQYVAPDRWIVATNLPIPFNCPGYVTPTPPPPPTCPAWFTRPETGKALLVVENHTGKEPAVALKGTVGINLDIPMAPKIGDEPGRYVLMLAPGHYELEASPYGMIIIDLAAGEMKVAPVYAPRVERRPVFDLPVPPACN